MRRRAGRGRFEPYDVVAVMFGDHPSWGDGWYATEGGEERWHEHGAAVVEQWTAEGRDPAELTAVALWGMPRTGADR